MIFDYFRNLFGKKEERLSEEQAIRKLEEVGMNINELRLPHVGNRKTDYYSREIVETSFDLDIGVKGRYVHITGNCYYRNKKIPNRKEDKIEINYQKPLSDFKIYSEGELVETE